MFLAHPASAGKKIIRGAPIFLDENGNSAPPPATASPAPSIASGPVPAPAPLSPAVTAVPSPVIRGYGGFWIGLVLLALLVWAKRLFKAPQCSFAFEPDLRAPGETAKGIMWTKRRPESISAIFELYRADDDVPIRSAPVTVGEPEQCPDGWRTTVAVALPSDIRPEFEGGWALSVQAVVNGRTIFLGDNVHLRSLWLDPPGPRAPGETLRGVLWTEEPPGALKASLHLYADDTESDAPLHSVSLAVGMPEKFNGGWRTIIETHIPNHARPESQWLLDVSDGAGVNERGEVIIRPT